MTAICLSDHTDELDADLLDTIQIEDTYGTDALDQLAEDYCRTVLTVEEITAYQRIAGVTTAQVIPMPARADSTTLRCAA